MLPRLLYWSAVLIAAVMLLYLMGAPGLDKTADAATRARGEAESAAAMTVGIGLLGMLAGKAWMDSIVVKRGRIRCPVCESVVHVSARHCHTCGAPLRTNRQMLEVLYRLTEPEPQAEEKVA